MTKTETVVVRGLVDEVEILIDEWGVPHIFAESEHDVYLAQGFNAARDRLYQIDLWRRRGLGQLAEIYGPAFIEQDRAARLFLYRGDMRAEWLAYGSSTKAIVNAFVEGINAYVFLLEERPHLVPPEFEMLGYLPALWSAEDVVRARTHGLFYNVEQELTRALTRRDFGDLVEDLRQIREPNDPRGAIPAIDIDHLSSEVLRVYRLAFAPGNPPSAGAEGADEGFSGSNNWVLGVTKTATGRPILANDPHRAVTLPSLRYIAHLSAPGMDIIGGGEPALPGISIGHNGSVAFGLTILPADQEDLYIYEINPRDEREYQYQGSWEQMSTATESIRVADGETIDVELEFTRHGPVIYRSPDGRLAAAVRAAWLQPGMAPYLSSLEYRRAQTSEDFRSALNRWGAPPVNQIYATPDGDIGWKASALVPIRPNWDGSMPVPGDGSYEWAGFYDADQTPGLHNPRSDWFGSANEMNLPDDYPNDAKTITYDWYSASRKKRLDEEFSGSSGFTIEHSVKMQSDTVSIDARTVCQLLAPLSSEPVGDMPEFQMLTKWSGDEASNSVEALIFEIWSRRHLRPWLIGEYLTRRGLSGDLLEDAKAVLLRDESYSSDLRPDGRMIEALVQEAPVETARAVAESLTAALSEIAERLGPDRSTWTWGSLLHAKLVHPGFASLPTAPAGWTTIGPASRGGSGDTPGMTMYDPSFRMTVGSTFRVVVDVGDWDRSRAMNSPGQSGDPRSPHYSDLFGSWAEGESFPLLYSRAAIEKNSELRLLLVPESSSRE